MAIPKPSTADIKVVMTDKGTMRLLYKGEPLPGVIRIECVQEPKMRATVNVTFIGPAVAFETEKAG